MVDLDHVVRVVQAALVSLVAGHVMVRRPERYASSAPTASVVRASALGDPITGFGRMASSELCSAEWTRAGSRSPVDVASRAPQSRQNRSADEGVSLWRE